VRVFWMLAYGAAILGGIEAFVGVSTATGAPQQAAGAAMGIAITVIPYCFARSWEKLSTSDESKQLKSLNDTLVVHTRLLAQIANESAERSGAGRISE